MKLCFVTGNKNKLAELQHALAEHDIEGISLDLPEVQGEPEEVIAHKAREACRLTGKNVIVEDTSLLFDALNGLPGPYIKHFIDKIGLEGTYRLLEAWDNKGATGVSHIAYSEPGQEPIIFKGSIKGTIVPPRGEGWGWDNIFVPEGEQRTYGEIGGKERSFRSMAVNKFRQFLDGK